MQHKIDDTRLLQSKVKLTHQVTICNKGEGGGAGEEGGGDGVLKKVPCLLLVHILMHYIFWMTFRIRW